MNTPPDLTTAALKMVLSLGFVLAILWGLCHLARRRLPFGQNGPKGRLIQVLESQYVGAKKSIAVVQVPGSILVLGIGADGVNLLTCIDDPDVMAGLKSKSSPNLKTVPSFKDQLGRLTRPLRSQCQPPDSKASTE